MSFAKTFLRLGVCVLIILTLVPSSSHAYKMLYPTSSSWANYVACDNLNGFAHWDHANLAFYYNPANLVAAKHAPAQAALEAALATWTNAAESDHQLSYAGRTTRLLDLLDNQNTMLWGGTSSLCRNNACHAITVVRYDSAQVLKEVDIVFNELMDWRTDGLSDTCSNTAAGTRLDTQGIATHELGHSVGLGHLPMNDPYYPHATMGGASCSTAARTLHSDDRAGLRCATDRYPFNPLYEGSLQEASCRTISGWGRNARYPNNQAYIELWNGSSLIGVHPSNPSFSIPTSWAFESGQWQTVGVKYTGTGTDLGGSPQDIICGVSMFPTQSPEAVFDTAGQVYTVGTQFSSSHNGYITEIGFRKGEQESGSNTLRLWTDSGAELASKPVSCTVLNYDPGVLESWWCWVTLDTPVAITAGARYRVTVNTNVKQAKTGCGIGSGITHGPLTAHAGFWSAGNTFPTTGSCSNFFVDVKFDI
jgi:hypothetical protein